jgi:nucleoid DNA-binding protein
MTIQTEVFSSRQTRIEILQTLAEKTGLRRTDVASVFDAMMGVIKSHMDKEGSGEVLLPMLGIKLRRVRRNPTKKRVMRSPLTGVEVVIPARPQRDDIKVSVLKHLKDDLLA